MATTQLQIALGSEKMIELAILKKADGVASLRGTPHYLSDDLYAKGLLLEKMTDKLLKLNSAEQPAKKGSVRRQSSIGGSVSDADTEELVSLAKGFANKETLIGHLATAGKTSRIDAVLKLDSAGKLTYKA